ncbi:MAG TPA: hypothetical protein PLR06_03685 [Cyclobacteriaceae bacterium]|nr:hypothetical protein [Cyclobacteriaceae bacterium]
MSDIQGTLVKVLVKEFYRVNAGFFLIVIGLCFGFMRGSDHVALARYCTSSPFLLMIPFLVWLLYSFQVISFNSLSIRKKENEFLLALGALPPSKIRFHLFATSLRQFLPAIAYAIFLMVIASRSQNLIIIIWIAGLILIPSFFISISLYRKIIHPDPGVAVSFLQRKMNTLFSKPYLLFYPQWIAGRQPVLVIGTKIMACLMIVAISQLYRFDNYDERLFTMGCALSFSFNLILVFHYQRFENFHFQVMRSLPITPLNRLYSFIMIWCVLLFPEIGTILNYFPTNLSTFQLIPLVAFGLSTGILAYGLLFVKDITLESFTQFVFWICLVWIVTILFKIPAAVLTTIHLALGTWSFQKNFYRFEFNAEIGSEK